MYPLNHPVLRASCRRKRLPPVSWVMTRVDACAARGNGLHGVLATAAIGIIAGEITTKRDHKHLLLVASGPGPLVPRDDDTPRASCFRRQRDGQVTVTRIKQHTPPTPARRDSTATSPLPGEVPARESRGGGTEHGMGGTGEGNALPRGVKAPEGSSRLASRPEPARSHSRLAGHRHYDGHRRTRLTHHLELPDGCCPTLGAGDGVDGGGGVTHSPMYPLFLVP